MIPSEASWATNRNLVRVIVAGFALVILVLLSAGGMGLRQAQVMHESASRMAVEQGATASVLGQLQLEQRTMSDVLYRLLHLKGPEDEAALLQRLDRLDATIASIDIRHPGLNGARAFTEVVRAVQDFSALARSLIQNPTHDPKELEALFQHHQRVQQIAEEAILIGLNGAIDNGKALEARANQMVRISLSLLGMGLALAILCAALTVRFAASTLRLLRHQSGELSRVSWQMIQGQEDAARRFSHELHDELGQSLAAVKANLVSLSPESLDEKRGDCMRLVDGAISNVRELSQLLRPVILDDFGLDAALRWLCERFHQRTGIEVDYRSSLSCRLPDRVETHLFRITQEALTNVARHSHASEVSVRLDDSNERAILNIADNGVGLEPARFRGGSLGLVGMRARAEHAGGTFRLRRPSAGGLELTAEIPLERETDDAITQNPDCDRG